MMLKLWRERNWQEVDASVYEQSYRLFGGSVITHPEIIRAVSDITDMPLRYLAMYHEDVLMGCVPVWEKYLAGSKKALKRVGKGRVIDFGNPEIILPISPDWMGSLPFKGEFVSDLHFNKITNMKQEDGLSISLARSYQPGEGALSKKFKYNRRRELRLLEKAGGSVCSISELSTTEFTQHYLRLFQKRWGFDIKGKDHLETFLLLLKKQMWGHFIKLNDEVIAIQLILMVSSASWLSAEYINGGVDSDYNELGPGSVLSYINTSRLEELAHREQKELRLSFGKSDQEYKDRWCSRRPVYTIT